MYELIFIHFLFILNAKLFVKGIVAVVYKERDFIYE